MVCQSGDFVDVLGRDCFWYEEPNVQLGCESLRDDSLDVDLTNDDGLTPWDECCFCGGGVMVPEVVVRTPAPTPPTPGRKLAAEPTTPSRKLGEQKMEVMSVSADIEGAPDDTRVVCDSSPSFVDPLGRDCHFYVAENIEQGCNSLHGIGDTANEFSWANDDGLSPWTECCWCGGGTLTLGYEHVDVAPMA